MEILDFLFSNIAFLIAVIWFIASIFSKSKREEQERNRNPRPVAQPVEDHRPTEDPRPVAEPIDIDNIPWEKARQVPTQDKVRQRTEELLAKAERIQDRERLHPRERHTHPRERLGAKHTPLATQGNSAEAKHVIDLSGIDRQSVVQGMVWSQVFGKPRAKEPHRTWPRYVHSRQK